MCSRANNVWGPYGETITLCTAGKGGHQGGIVDLPDGSYWGYLHQDDGAIGRPPESALLPGRMAGRNSAGRDL